MKVNELNHIVKVDGNIQQSENLQKMAFSIGIYWSGSFESLKIVNTDTNYLVFSNNNITYTNRLYDNEMYNNFIHVSYRQMMSIMKQIKFENGICYDSPFTDDEIDYKTSFEKQIELNEKLTTMNEELLEKQKVLSIAVNDRDNEILKLKEFDNYIQDKNKHIISVNDKLKETMTRQNDVVCRLREDLTNSESYIAEVDTKCKRLERNLEHSIQRRQELKVSCNNLYSENTKFHNTIETINKQLNLLRLNNVKLYDKNDNQASKLVEQQDEINQLHADMSQYQYEEDNEYKKIVTNLNIMLVDRNRQIYKLQADNTELENRCNNFEKRIDNMNEVSGKPVVFKGTDVSIQIGGNRVECFKSMRFSVDTDFEVEETENEKQLKQTMERLNDRIVKLSIKNNKQTGTINKLNVRIYRLQDDNSCLTVRVDDRCRMISGLKFRINNLMQDIIGLESDKSSLNGQIEQYIKENLARNSINTRQFYHICPKCQLKGFITLENLRAVDE